jgi:hypothetical protein
MPGRRTLAGLLLVFCTQAAPGTAAEPGEAALVDALTTFRQQCLGPSDADAKQAQPSTDYTVSTLSSGGCTLVGPDHRTREPLAFAPTMRVIEGELRPSMAARGFVSNGAWADFKGRAQILRFVKPTPAGCERVSATVVDLMGQVMVMVLKVRGSGPEAAAACTVES